MSTHTFATLGLAPSIITSLAAIGYTKPTPIQAATIPLGVAGKDLLGSSQTGSGKTAAFILPLLHTLLQHPSQKALVLTPTRDLATQIVDFAHEVLAPSSNISTALLIGDQPMERQLRRLRKGASLIVGTPGRVTDHFRRRSLEGSCIKMLVLDETDRMLDMGFAPQIETIVATLHTERQTLMFSATFPPHILKVARRYLKEDAQQVVLQATQAPAANITQEARYVSSPEEKEEALTHELGKRKGKIIIFVKTKRGTERLAKRLSNQGHAVTYIHGDLRQRQRERVIRALKEHQGVSQGSTILVATDVVGRGIDVADIGHVLNYDLPQTREDYIHRIGRTGRGEATGEALSFVSPYERKEWHAIAPYADPTGKLTFPTKEARKAPNKRSKGHSWRKRHAKVRH